MSGQMKGTLIDDFKQYTEDQQMLKQAAQPVKNYRYPNPQKYTNPPEKFEQSQQTTIDDQNSSLTKADVQADARKERARLLRQRAGLGSQNAPRKFKNQHKKWGNFLVLYEGSFSITLGPDYWCFIPTFICFTIASLAILSLLFSKTSSLIVKVSGLIICLGQLIAYALIATSNPGIAKEQDQNYSLQAFEHPQRFQPTKVCSKCGFSVPKSSYHCRDCDVCILEYDHHCPWTSKCIGRDNICRFYFFLAMTPIFLIYIAVVFVIVMSQEGASTRVHTIRNL